MTRSIAPSPAVSTVTGVGGSCPSPASSFGLAFPHPHKRAAAMVRPIIFVRILKSSRECLQTGKGDSITRQTVVVSISRGVQRVLRVHYFKSGGFSRLIAQNG